MQLVYRAFRIKGNDTKIGLLLNEPRGSSYKLFSYISFTIACDKLCVLARALFYRAMDSCHEIISSNLLGVQYSVSA